MNELSVFARLISQLRSLAGEHWYLGVALLVFVLLVAVGFTVVARRRE
jgi:hypothetical protein